MLSNAVQAVEQAIFNVCSSVIHDKLDAIQTTVEEFIKHNLQMAEFHDRLEREAPTVKGGGLEMEAWLTKEIQEHRRLKLISEDKIRCLETNFADLDIMMEVMKPDFSMEKVTKNEA